MERSLEEIVAVNLAELRRAKGWTQADLAEKINYSDKSVSKWERGEGLPDLKVICQLADLFGVTADTLVRENGAAVHLKQTKPQKSITMRVLMELLTISIVLLVATVVYVGFAQQNLWMCFVWALPISFGLITLLNVGWKSRVPAIVFGSIFAWLLLAAVYLQLLSLNLWMLFLIGAPTQAAIILGAQLKHKKKSKERTPQP